MQAPICTVSRIRCTDVFDQNPCPFTRNTTLDEHALYPLVFCVRTLLVNTPFYPRACVCSARVRVCVCSWVEKGRKGCTTVLTSVQGGTWPLAVGGAGRDEGVIRVERTCLLLYLFPTSGFIFLRLAATLSLSSDELPPGELKGKCGNVPQPLTSLFRNALISVASHNGKGKGNKKYRE